MGLGSGIRKKPIPDSGSGSRGQKGTGSATLLLTNVFLFCCFQSSAAEASVDAAYSAGRHAARRDDSLLGRARPLLPASPGGGRDRPFLPPHTRCETVESRGSIVADQ
jgi:hypothetical protein